MRITMMAIGSRGDVQPLVALGAGLLQAGHQVRLAAGDEFEGLVAGADLEFVPLGFNIQAIMQQHTDFFRFAHDITDSVLKACDGKEDAIVATLLGVSTCQVARERGIPFFYVVPLPSLCTQDFPNPMFPPFSLGRAYNRWTFNMANGFFARSYEYARCLFQEPRPPYLFCFSSHVVPRPSDWGEHAHVTGYWFLDHPVDWQPPRDLVDFLDAGPPPVCIGFGSMLDGHPKRVTDTVLDALARSKQRGVLVKGWGGLSQADLPSDVLMVDTVPFDWLFPRVAVAVHHGGAGTTSMALRAGIPSVVVPFGLDQPFWGRRVKSLGVGLGPIPLKRLTAERLSAAITVAATDEQMRVRAADLGARIRAEDGVGNAVRIIEQVIG
ncbi:MAG: glycosyltransferase family 1 protein [Anaerolineae bacterium]|nr:glycosyltransferase family 1 protein [Anaerolineae bacterium]